MLQEDTTNPRIKNGLVVSNPLLRGLGSILYSQMLFHNM